MENGGRAGNYASQICTKLANSSCLFLSHYHSSALHSSQLNTFSFFLHFLNLFLYLLSHRNKTFRIMQYLHFLLTYFLRLMCNVYINLFRRKRSNEIISIIRVVRYNQYPPQYPTFFYQSLYAPEQEQVVLQGVVEEGREERSY